MTVAPDDRLRDGVIARLAEALDDRQLAARPGPHLFDAMLTWTPPTWTRGRATYVVHDGLGRLVAIASR